MDTINNNQMSEYTTRLEQFKTNNGTVYTTDQVHPDLYIVYSYGEHWPMYVYDDATATWIGNGEKYDQPTTNRHASLSKPNVEDIKYLNRDELDRLITLGGYSQYCADRCTH